MKQDGERRGVLSEDDELCGASVESLGDCGGTEPLVREVLLR